MALLLLGRRAARPLAPAAVVELFPVQEAITHSRGEKEEDEVERRRRQISRENECRTDRSPSRVLFKSFGM